MLKIRRVRRFYIALGILPMISYIRTCRIPQIRCRRMRSTWQSAADGRTGARAVSQAARNSPVGAGRTRGRPDPPVAAQSPTTEPHLAETAPQSSQASTPPVQPPEPRCYVDSDSRPAIDGSVPRRGGPSSGRSRDRGPHAAGVSAGRPGQAQSHASPRTLWRARAQALQALPRSVPRPACAYPVLLFVFNGLTTACCVFRVFRVHY